MDTFILRVLLCLNIYVIGGLSYSQGTLLKYLKRIDSKLDKLEKEENEIDSRKRYALPPLPDIALEDIYSNPKWYSRARHFRPRFRKLQFKKDLHDTGVSSDNNVLNNDISSDNIFTQDNYSLDSSDGEDSSLSNSITPQLYSEKVISDNLDERIHSKTLPSPVDKSRENDKRLKELEQALDYVSQKVNRLVNRESDNNSEWFEERFNQVADPSELLEEKPDGLEETDDSDMSNILRDLSDFADQLSDSSEGNSKIQEPMTARDDLDRHDTDDSLAQVVSRLTRRIDQVIKSLPPVPLQNADDVQAVDRALPPLPNSRALPPLPKTKALPPLPNSRALPPLPNSRALASSLKSKAFPPLPQNRALPPLPNIRALPPLPNSRAVTHNRALPPLPSRMSQEKRQELVRHINELSRQIKSLSGHLDEPDFNVNSNSSPLLFGDVGSNQIRDDRELILDVKNISTRVERLMSNYDKLKKDTDMLDKAYEDSMNSEQGLDPFEKPLTLRTAEFETALDTQDDTENLEEALSNLAKRRDVKLDIPAMDGDSSTTQGDDDELLDYIQRINQKVDHILQNQNQKQDLDSEDELLNNTQRGMDPCKGIAVLNQKEGAIEYPTGHGKYSSFQDCRWFITGSSPNQKVRIKFTMMSIERDSPCDDYVQVSQVDQRHPTVPKKVYARLCEKSLSGVPASKKEFVVEGPYVMIHFHSDWIWTARGFGLRYRIEDGNAPSKPQPTPAPAPSGPLPEPCKGSGVTVRGDRGTIDFYSGYPDKARCRWFIAGDKDSIGIRVKVTAIDLELSRDCAKDKLTIASVNLQKKTFKSIKEMCGSSVPSTAIEVPTNNAYVVLTSDAKIHFRGFQLQFEQIKKSSGVPPQPATPQPPVLPKPPPTSKPGASKFNDPCKGHGAILHSNKGVIDFTGGYKNRANCSWFIAADKEAHQIWVTITKVDIKGTGRKCAGDRLLVAAIYMNQNKVEPVDVICGSKAPTDSIIIPSQHIYLGFRSDGSGTGDGFKLSYSASFPEHPPMTTTLAPGAPKPKPTKPSPSKPLPSDLQGLSCSFDPGTSCKWGNLKTKDDPLDFKIQTAGSNGWRSYAKTDHTTGSAGGAYAYLQANEAKPGSRGTLKSPKIKAAPGNGMCLSFWYNMYDTFGRFTVDIIPQGQSEETLFVLDGNQGNMWHEAKVALVSDVPFEIYLTHFRGEKATETGLAIDDVKVTNTPCLSTPLACGQTKFHSRGKRDLDSPEGFERAIDELKRDVTDLENVMGLSEEKNLTKRIMSGQASRQGEWPWIVHLRNFHHGISAGVYSQCGGTLISPKWILSAAHCFEGDNGEVKKDPNNVLLYFGEHNTGYASIEQSQFSLKPKKVMLHPNRNKRAPGSAAHRYDYALIELKAKVPLTENVNVACLPVGPTPVGSKCVAAGWGVSDSGDTSVHLLHITQQVINRRQCMYRTFEDQVCAISVKGYGDVCQGDSGGPLVCQRKDGKYEVIGAVSFGDKCSNRKRTPGVYANVHHAMSWIQTTMGNFD